MYNEQKFRVFLSHKENGTRHGKFLVLFREIYTPNLHRKFREKFRETYA